MTHRQEVIRLYRQILHIGKRWPSIAGVTDGEKEAEYIEEEARHLFRKNKDLTETEEIQQCIKEAQARMEMALHYKNPYPRPINYPQTVLPPSGKLRTGTRRTMDRAKPVYIKSYDID